MVLGDENPLRRRVTVGLGIPSEGVRCGSFDQPHLSVWS